MTTTKEVLLQAVQAVRAEFQAKPTFPYTTSVLESAQTDFDRFEKAQGNTIGEIKDNALAAYQKADKTRKLWNRIGMGSFAGGLASYAAGLLFPQASAVTTVLALVGVTNGFLVAPMFYRPAAYRQNQAAQLWHAANRWEQFLEPEKATPKTNPLAKSAA